MWGRDDATMGGTMRHMWRMGGFKPFYTAYRVTAVREGVRLLRCCISLVAWS